ncbi:MAG TPA: restriction endonuclease subunit S [Gaiellaceae bacterium]
MNEGVVHESSSAWRVVRFGDVLTRVERQVAIDDALDYATVGVRWYGKGAFVRERLPGAEIAAKRQAVIHAGDVVYNKLFAWKGSFAVADDTVHGHLVSGEFPTYDLVRSKLDPKYLSYYFQTAELGLQAARLSRGVAAISRLRLNPPQFMELTIPLPPVAEQQRLVAILDHAQAKLTEAQRLRRDAQAETTAFVMSAIGKRLAAFRATGTVGDVLIGKPRNGWSAPCDNTEDGVAVLSLGAVTGFTYRPTEFKRTSEATTPEGHYWLEPGDLLVTRSNTEQLLGHAAIYSGEPAPCIYPDLMMRLKVDPSAADTRFLYYWLRTPDVRARIQKAGSGTSSTMKKITQKDLMGLPFPVGLNLAEQQTVVRSLDELVSRIEDARSAQQGTGQDLASLMPALLDRAFQGELRTPSGVTPGGAAA